MASRRPLSARNVDKNHGTTIVKKKRYPFVILNRQALAESVRQVVKEAHISPAVTFSEEDILKPTPEKAQQIYFSLGNVMFGVSADAFKQVSFQLNHVDHSELLDDVTFRIQFFRLMKRFMRMCMIVDFTLVDAMEPDSKRFIRNLSGVINYVKFSCIYRESPNMKTYQEALSQVVEELQIAHDGNKQRREQLAEIERQRCEENELKEELKQKLGEQEQEMHVLKLHQESLQQQLHSECEQKARSEQKTAQVTKELGKWTLRYDVLKKQIVSSPDKLEARLSKLQEEVEEVQRNSRHTESDLANWESLASKAHQVPTVLKRLREDKHLMLAQVEKKSEVLRQLDLSEEHICRQKQLLRESTAKHQNLLRHLKLVEEESRQVAYNEQRVPHSQARDDLERDVFLLQQEMRQRGQKETQLRKEIEEQEQILVEKRTDHGNTCKEVAEMFKALKKAYKTQKENSSEIMYMYTL